MPLSQLSKDWIILNDSFRIAKFNNGEAINGERERENKTNKQKRKKERKKEKKKQMTNFLSETDRAIGKLSQA